MTPGIVVVLKKPPCLSVDVHPAGVVVVWPLTVVVVWSFTVVVV